MSAHRGSIRWSSYWGTWSRVLRHLGRDQTCVEVNLSPVNHDIPENWVKIGMVWIREHGTTPGKDDKFERRLPETWFKAMAEHVNKDVRHLLLTADILPMIDFDKYRAVSNGGAPLSKILKEGIELPDFVTRAE